MLQNGGSRIGIVNRTGIMWEKQMRLPELGGLEDITSPVWPTLPSFICPRQALKEDKI